MIRINEFKFVTFFVIVTMISFTGCSKDSPLDDYPKNVTIKYKVSSSISDVTANIEYINETGDDSEDDNVNLPYIKTVSKKVDYAEIIKLVASSDDAEDLHLEIIVDGKTMESKTFESSTYNIGVLMYLFD